MLKHIALAALAAFFLALTGPVSADMDCVNCGDDGEQYFGRHGGDDHGNREGDFSGEGWFYGKGEAAAYGKGETVNFQALSAGVLEGWFTRNETDKDGNDTGVSGTIGLGWTSESHSTDPDLPAFSGGEALGEFSFDMEKLMGRVRNHGRGGGKK